MNFVVVIPARYNSTRLPGKPLVMINGVEMIVRTYSQCLKAVEASKIYVATDDDRIVKVCDDNNIQVLMTPHDCMTGTDRIAEVAKSVAADCYINVQGDEPLFNPMDIKMLIKQASQNPEDIINGYTPIHDEAEFRSGSIPKVVMRPDNRLLYMSRAPIPTSKEHDFPTAFRQVCAYAFPKSALLSFSESTQKTPLESIEDIEILRFLELGYDVRMILMSDDSIAVDNPEDVGKVETRLAKTGIS